MLLRPSVVRVAVEHSIHTCEPESKRPLPPEVYAHSSLDPQLPLLDKEPFLTTTFEGLMLPLQIPLQQHQHRPRSLARPETSVQTSTEAHTTIQTACHTPSTVTPIGVAPQLLALVGSTISMPAWPIVTPPLVAPQSHGFLPTVSATPKLLEDIN